jgi:putative FmdB family regulatory protein
MPLYSYTCDECGRAIEEFRPVEDRDGGIHICNASRHRSGLLVRSFQTPHIGLIGGIPNRFNQSLNEGGRVVPSFEE